MEEKKEHRAVAKKIFEPMMKEWEPVSPKMPEPVVQEEPQEDVEPVVEEQPEIIPEPVDEEPHSNVALSDNKSGKGMGWYVVHTYSGYENKVKVDIEKTIENRNLQDQILEVMVPMQTVVEERNGEKKQVQKKMFPAYVLINMIMNDQTWYVVRNTRGVTGFVGPGSKPVPLTEEEIANMGFLAEAEASPFSIGDHVIVTEGVWQDTDGVVQEVHPAKQMAVIVIDMFGRDTPVEIDFSELKLV